MKRFFLTPALAALAFTVTPVDGAAPVISDLTAAQRVGTHLVDIAYDVAADTPTVGVALEVSVDGGTTWNVPVAATSGDIGEGLAVGAGKTIVWDAGVDWNNDYSAQTRYRVTAYDGMIAEVFAPIPAGSFTMGRTSGDGDSNAPPVTVNVSAFYMAKHEVTKVLWDEVRIWGLSNGYTDLPAGAGKAANHPVHSIDWYAMVKWCNARSEKEGLASVYYTNTDQTTVYRAGWIAVTNAMVKWDANGYRLPTEAEWEKAARGGVSGKRFPWGTDTITHSQANYSSTTAYSYDISPTRGYHPTYNDGTIPYTSPVGSFAANGYGLHDMAGNVWERCWDWYSASTYTAGATDPRGPASGSDRVRRGGSWGVPYAKECRAAFRYWYYGPGDVTNDIGFRLARSSVPDGSPTATGFATTPDGVLDTRAWTLSAAPATHGSIQGAGSYLSGTTATLTAAANPGYAFIGWTGDATGSANPLHVLMDANKTVVANFAPSLNDADSDGLLDYVEAFSYGTNPNLPDTDGDGLSDAWEVGLGRFSVINGAFTWAEARTDALARGGELASFPTENLWNRALQSIGESVFLDVDGLWIGATDESVEGTWQWETDQPFTFTNWAVGEPNNISDSDYVAVAGDLGGSIGKWYDYRAVTLRDGYIMETGFTTDPTSADTDGDEINDGTEITGGTNPRVADTDGDLLTDGQEVNLTQTSPLLADSNGNGISDADEDSDGDGLSNLNEITVHGTDPLKADTDGDGLSDGFEISFPASYYMFVPGSFTYPQAASDATTKRGRVASFPDVSDYSRMAYEARQSTQGYVWIGLTDAADEGVWVWTDGTTSTYSRWLTGEPSGGATENHVVIMENSTQWADTMESYIAAGYLFERVGLDPLDPDTDADGLSDGQEVNTTLSSPVLDDTDGDGLLDGAEVNTHGSSPLKADTDEDGLNDRVEVEVHHSNPSLKDSDGDGFEDLFEVNTGFNPALATSTPDALSSIRTAVEFRFNAANGVSYRIESSTDLDQWNTIETDIIGQSAVVTRFYSIENQPKRYFRVRRN